MADSSQVELAYALESTFGEVPTGAFTKVRHTGGSFGADTQTTRSDEVRSDAQRGQTVRTGWEPSAEVNMELSAQTFDDFIEAVLRDEWQTPADRTEDLDYATSEDYDEAIVNGTGTPSMSLQLQHLDVNGGDAYRVIRGARVGEWSLSASSNEIITGSFNLMGTDYDAADTAYADSVEEAPDTEVFNSIDYIKAIKVDGTEASGEVTEFSLNATMNARRLNSIGRLGAYDIGLGALDLTGSLNFYLDGETWSRLKDYIDFKKMSITVEMEDGDGNGYAIHLPRVAVTNEPGNVPGPDEDVMLSFDFSAEPGGSSNKTLEVYRKQAA